MFWISINTPPPPPPEQGSVFFAKTLIMMSIHICKSFFFANVHNIYSSHKYDKTDRKVKRCYSNSSASVIKLQMKLNTVLIQFQDGSSLIVRCQKNVRKLYICWKKDLLSLYVDAHRVSKIPPPLPEHHPQLLGKSSQ